VAVSGLVIEPFGAAHDRAAFSCGVEPLDRYLHQQAGQDVRRNVAAVFVTHEPDLSSIAGYYTLSATSIELTDLPMQVVKRLPRYPVLPAILLGRLAVDRRYRKRGVGELLLLSALRRSFNVHIEIGTIAVVVDAKDNQAQAFYERYGFVRFREQERRLFLPMKTIEQLFDA
jgi:ribosomal protein S18 acetylase RimI-like enzyme